TVIDPGDAGAGLGLAGDLRYCITQANASPGGDVIRFAIPGAGLHTIGLNSALPAITDSVLLDGYTQPGASPNTLAAGDNAVLAIELNRGSAPLDTNGLTITASNCTIRGLAIDGFAATSFASGGGTGIAVQG